MCLCNPICSWKPCGGLHAADISCVNKNSIHPQKAASWSGLIGRLPKGGPFFWERALIFWRYFWLPFRTPTYCSFLGVINLDIFYLLGNLGLAGAEGGFHVTGVWGEFPSLQCSSCAKAVFMSMKVRDLKEYEVGLEVAMCRRVYQTLVCAYGTVLQNSGTKHPSL